MEKQTAVEFLLDCIIDSNASKFGDVVLHRILLNNDIDKAKQLEAEQNKITGDTTDGFHTFNELYEFRMYYNAALFNEWARTGQFSVHKSLRHHDGELCFGGEWFIVCAVLPDGQQISNHYHIKHWYLFKIPIKYIAIHPYDGHTSKDVIDRLHKFITENPQNNE